MFNCSPAPVCKPTTLAVTVNMNSSHSQEVDSKTRPVVEDDGATMTFSIPVHVRYPAPVLEAGRPGHAALPSWLASGKACFSFNAAQSLRFLCFIDLSWPSCAPHNDGMQSLSWNH